MSSEEQKAYIFDGEKWVEWADLLAERDRYKDALLLVHKTAKRAVDTALPTTDNSMCSYILGVCRGALGMPPSSQGNEANSE